MAKVVEVTKRNRRREAKGGRREMGGGVGRRDFRVDRERVDLRGGVERGEGEGEEEGEESASSSSPPSFTSANPRRVLTMNITALAPAAAPIP